MRFWAGLGESSRYGAMRRFLVGQVMLLGLLPLLAFGLFSTPLAAATVPSAAATARSVHSLPLAPYSSTPPKNRPYPTCPPPTKSRNSCSAVAVPKGARDRLHPALEGSGEKGGLSPADLASAYKLPSVGGSGMTIAVVAAYDYPTAESDLAVYRARYGLPACTTANGCFKKVNQKGEATNYPAAESGWSTEMALDLDMASAICPECKLLLVEGNTNSDSDLWQAVDTAANLGANVISNSWGREESASELEGDEHFNHPGIPVLAATGDWGYGTLYPAASPYVVAVGGTSLYKDGNSTRGWTEEVWSGAGSGCSLYEPKPKWQLDGKCPNRVIADVAAVSDPATGVSIYDSYKFEGWSVFGGTSAATPILAGIEALSSSTTRSAGPEAFYKAPNWLSDVTVGANGTCAPPAETEYLCTGELGYDGPTGNGVPILGLSGEPAVASRATEVKSYSATIKGTVNPEGSATTFQFEYGKTTSYGERAPIQPGSAGSGTSKISVSTSPANLDPETLYHYRLSATNGKGTTYGEDHTFLTTSPAWATIPTFFGTLSGSGSNQFNEPVRVAVESTTGVIVILDWSNKVLEFTPSGEFIRSFGSGGSGPGQFKGANGLATDASGNIWVADSGNHRIQKFTEGGSFVRAFGTEGTANGQFKFPYGVTIDAAGNVWVADSGNNRVQKFNSNGVFLSKFNVAGKFPTGIAIGPNGNVWTSNFSQSANMIEEHSPTGASITAFAPYGNRLGQVTEAWGIAVDANENVWVADQNHNLLEGVNYSRIEIFSPHGALEGYFGAEGKNPDQMQFPTAVALDPRGNVWIADLYNSRIDRWKVPSPWPPTFANTVGTKGSGNGQFNEPSGVAVEPGNGVVVAVDYLNNKVQELTASGEFIRSFGSGGSGPGQFKGANGVATDASGNIWVADTGNNRIQKFTEAGAFVRSIGTEGTGSGQFKFPYAVTTDDEGNVWVADSGNNRVQKFSTDGVFLSEFSVGSFPTGVAIGPNGNVWTSSFSNSKIEVRTSAGALVRSFGALGEGNGQLWSPRGIAVDASENVWVADQNNNRVQVFSKTGTYLTTFGGKGVNSNQMQSPTAVALDPRGNVWIADLYNSRIDRWKR